MTQEIHVLDGGNLEGVLLKSTYYIEHKVGKGGMAWVYKAAHIERDDDRNFALKILFSQLSANPEVRQRFLREAAILQQLRHPHIVGIQSIVEEKGLLGILLEWCDGGDLKEWTDKQTFPLPLDQVHGIMLPLMEAVAHAHQEGYVHRDLKLQNILLQREGGCGGCIPKVTDFGVAKALSTSTVTQTGAMMGTLEFMSPEQLRDAKRIDHRADIYSLGVMLYYLCTGFYPFNGNQHQLIMQILSYEAPIPEGAPPQVIPVIMRCLAKDPDDRYASCMALRDAWCGAVGDIELGMIEFIAPSPHVTQDLSETILMSGSTDEAHRTQVAPPTVRSPVSHPSALRSVLTVVFLLVLGAAAFVFWSKIL